MPLIWSLFCFCASVSLSACRWVCLPPATFWMLIFLFVTLSVCWPSYPVPLKISLCLLILVASQPCLIVLDVSCMDDCLSACQPLCLCVFLFGKVVNVWRPLLPIYKKIVCVVFNCSVFWDLYCAAPERRDSCEHSSEAKAFHDYVRRRKTILSRTKFLHKLSNLFQTLIK